MRYLRFIVNADDLGLSVSTNAAIAGCIERGEITSATILANGPDFAGAVEIARALPGISYGVHLNATEFKPLSQANLAQVTNGDVFDLSLRQHSLSTATLRAIRSEFEAQIQSVLAKGIAVSHLDSHHHIHTVPALFPVVVGLAKQYRIPSVRPTRNIYRVGEKKTAFIRAGKVAWNAALRATGLCRVERFGSLTDFLNRSAGLADCKSFEIMVHPGSTCAGDAEEIELLATPWWRSACDTPILETYWGVAPALGAAAGRDEASRSWQLGFGLAGAAGNSK